jgi:hypothetical protein
MPGRRLAGRSRPHRVAGFGRSFPELADAASHRCPEIGKFAGSPDDQDHHQNDDQLGKMATQDVHANTQFSAPPRREWNVWSDARTIGSRAIDKCVEWG